MKPLAYKRFTLVSGICSFLIGSGIYLCFRSTDLQMFQLFPNSELPFWARRLRTYSETLNVPEWVRFSLPDGLWLLAYLLIIDCIWGGQRSPTSLFFLAILPIAIIIVELLQMIHLISGVGDWMDILFYFLSIVLFLTIKMFVI